MSLLWNHMAHATLGIFNVPFVTGDDVNMDMEYALAGGRSNVNADIVTIRLEFLVQSGVRSKKLATWRRGITRVWPGLTA